MKTEFEVKILEIDVPAIVRKLDSLGAKKIAERCMRRFVYDLEKTEFSCKSWIRLRDDGEKTTLTLKEISSDAIDGTKEIEFVVGDFGLADHFLQKLGFSPTAYQENRRVQYLLDGVEIDIDSWPKIPAYLEVEAESAELVEKTVKLLGFEMSDVTSIGVGDVFKKYGFNIHDFKELKF